LKRLTRLQKNILRFVQADIPCVPRPYAELAKDNSVDETEIAAQIKVLKKAGYIRRFGAILSHKKVGLKANCMCVWKVPKDKIEIISKAALAMPQISHCYLRKTLKNWPYNFYTMIHGKTKKQCRQIIEALAGKSKVKDFRMLFTKKQFKKTSPRYNV
jgi:DNA-binding Lrp family transcriptional regulator